MIFLIIKKYQNNNFKMIICEMNIENKIDQENGGNTLINILKYKQLYNVI